MPGDNVLAALGVQVFFGLVLLVAQWPTPRATRLLQRWGVPERPRPSGPWR